MTRLICGLFMGFPLFFLALTIAILLKQDTPHDMPLLLVALAVLAVAITPTAPYVRERIAAAGISVHKDNPQAWRRMLPVYSTFAAATIAGFLVAQAPALFGFVASALTRNLLPLAVGSAGSFVAWAIMWPRRALWSRWTVLAGIGAAPETDADAHPEAQPQAHSGSGEGATP
jgi:hypothetical protein